MTEDEIGFDDVNNWNENYIDYRECGCVIYYRHNLTIEYSRFCNYHYVPPDDDSTPPAGSGLKKLF